MLLLCPYLINKQKYFHGLLKLVDQNAKCLTKTVEKLIQSILRQNLAVIIDDDYVLSYK